MQTLQTILKSTSALCLLLLLLPCDVSALPSTVEIVDLELQDPPTDDEMTKTRTKKVTFDLTDQSATTSTKTDYCRCFTLLKSCFYTMPACRFFTLLASCGFTLCIDG